MKEGEAWHKCRLMRSALLTPFLLLALALAAMAQEPPPKLKVGIFDFPPLAMKDEDGRWCGLAVELWEEVSTRAQVAYEYEEVPPDKLIGRLSRGEIDLAVGILGVSAERERVVDFTQPYLENTAAAAFLKNARHPAFRELWAELTQQDLLQVLLFMLVALLVFSLVLWLIERGVHTGHFGGKPIHGLGSAIWFSAVTMTTVGYGDKTPQTLPGRILAFLWMFFGILLVSAFTGTVASSLTIARLNQSIDRLNDLSRFRNGVMNGSLMQNAMTEAGISARLFPSLEAGLKALEDKEITALVGDAVSLRYLVGKDHPHTLVVDKFPTSRIAFAMAARPGLANFQDINIALIDVIGTPQWDRAVDRWIGPDPSK